MKSNKKWFSWESLKGLKPYLKVEWRDIFFLSIRQICVLPFLVLTQWWILVGLLGLKIPLFIKSEFGFLMLFKLLVLLLFFHMNFYLSWLLSSMFLEFDIFDHSLISFLSIAKCILCEVFGCRVFLIYLTVHSSPLCPRIECHSLPNLNVCAL